MLLALAAFACDREPVVTTFKVEPERFVRRVTAEGNLKAKNSTVISAPASAPEAMKIAWIVDDGARLKKDDVIVRFDPTDFETELVGGTEDDSTAGNKLTKSAADASATKRNLQRDAGQATAELESARRFRFDDAEVFSRYQRIESQVDEGLALDKRQHAENVLGVRDALARADRELIDIDRKKAELKIRNAERGLKSLEVRAPYDGVVVLQRDWRGDVPRVGSNVWNGSVIGEMPDLREMKAEVFVLEADGAGLAVGQKASVALESQPGVAYPGKIAQIDKLARPRFRGVPVQYFGVTVALDRFDPKVMKPGARVHAVLEVENRANAVSIPRQALFDKEGKKVVYRKRGDHFEPVVVTIASATPGRVVVTSGLAKGDEVALADPTAAKRQTS